MLVYTWSDGGCKPNPGPAAAAAVVTSADGETLTHRGIAIEHATNNVAEWKGFVASLEAAIDVGAREVIAHVDSQLVARQFRGTYSVSENFQPFVARAHALAAQLDRVEVREIPREQNKAADAICNAVMAGTYVPFGESPPVAAGKAAVPIRVSLLVEVELDPKLARDEQSEGADPRAQLRELAKRVSGKLPLCARASDVVRVTRVTG